MTGFGDFFNRMFSTFSNADFAALMGVQFLVMAADGLIRGSIAKSIAFGGQEGFDITTVPSADYLLKVVLALYVPYTFLSPFIGVLIDRFSVAACSRSRAWSRRSSPRCSRARS